MGCFSFMCKECGKPILSNSFAGQLVKLFLLKDGEVIEEMEGQYDSYGRVFDDNMDSIEWKMPWAGWAIPEGSTELTVCDLMGADARSGIAAVHTKCWKGNVPTAESDYDPDQGWGFKMEDEP